jgi:hypothetical protein
VHPSLPGGGGPGMYTTLAGFTVGSVSGGRWQQKRCICTGQLAIGEADGLDTHRTPFLLFAALHQAAVHGRERRVRLTAMNGGLVTGPGVGLSSGCLCRAWAD